MIEYDPDRNGGIDREEEKKQQGKKILDQTDPSFTFQHYADAD